MTPEQSGICVCDESELPHFHPFISASSHGYRVYQRPGEAKLDYPEKVIVYEVPGG
jgi:hypothetical protein